MAGNEVGLELNTYGYDMTDPDAEVPMNKKTIRSTSLSPPS